MHSPSVRNSSPVRPLTLAFAIALTTFALPATPQTTSGAYNIEVIVFRAGGSAADAGAATEPMVSGGDSGAGDGGVARFVGTLPAASLQLGGIAARLRSSGAYRPLAHAGWVQTASPWGSRSGFSVGRVGLGADGLAGTTWLERGQYLHLGFTLTLGRATINEIRRVRLGEKNYFDNPEFGVIAVVTAAR